MSYPGVENPAPEDYRYQDPENYNWLMGEILRHETEQAHALGKLLAYTLYPSTVIDVGCGPGIYLVPFKERGAQVYGIDGASKAGENLEMHEFELVDLRNPWTPPRRYDLALCIEVAEHLQPVHAPTLVATLVGCADTIFFTAARPGQGGEGHFNEQDKAYWLNLFGAHGFGRHAQNDAVMNEIHDSYRRGESSPYFHCHWLHWNGMLVGRL